MRTRLCLVDEPSIGPAPKIAAEACQRIELLTAQEMTILPVDHNARRVAKMPGHVYVPSPREITAQGRRKDFEGGLHEQVKSRPGMNF